MNQSTLTLPSSFLRTTPKEPKYGLLFFGLIWLAFALPVTWWTSFPFIVGHSNFSELSLLAMPFVYLLYPQRKALWHTPQLKIAIFLTGVFCFVFVGFQYLFYGGSIPLYLQTNRTLIPFYCAMALLFLGPRLGTNRLLFHLTAALVVSYMLSILVFITGFKFYGFFRSALDDEAFEIVRKGRIFNVNSGFGYIAIPLVCFAYSARQKNTEKITLAWLMASCIMAVGTSVLSFNRTFLGIGAFFLAVAAPFVLKPKALIAVIILVLAGVGAASFAYHSNDTVRYQFDKRIFDPLQHDEMVDRLFYSGRSELYSIYAERLPYYWTTGVPPRHVVARTMYGDKSIDSTDISLLTLWWRHGFFSLLGYVAVLAIFYAGFLKQKRLEPEGVSLVLCQTLVVALPLMLLASLNIDVLVRHLSVVHLAIVAIAVSGKGSRK